MYLFIYPRGKMWINPFDGKHSFMLDLKGFLSIPVNELISACIWCCLKHRIYSDCFKCQECPMTQEIAQHFKGIINIYGIALLIKCISIN